MLNCRNCYVYAGHQNSKPTTVAYKVPQVTSKLY